MHSTKGTSEQVKEEIKKIFSDHDEELANRSSELNIFGRNPSFNSAHKLTASSASAIGAFAVAVEKWWELANNSRQSIGIDLMQAACALNPGHFQKQNGRSLPALSLLTELKADFYKTKDGKRFFPIGSYPHLRDGVLDLLNCPNSASSLGSAIGTWNADELEDAFASAKLPGAYARTPEEWRGHPQGKWLSTIPVIQVEKIGQSRPEGPRVKKRALDGIRVLDFGHVIAGPVVARSLAEHGAEVLRLDHPLKQDPFRQTIDTNIGKRSAFMDFNNPNDVAITHQLMSSADVVVQSWRHGSLARRGLGPLDAASIRPGIIYVSVSAYGDQGPWATRGGFEQLGQVVSGIAVTEGEQNAPKLVPTYLLNDYLTAYLGATGVMIALLRRAQEGGSYHVKVSLTRTSMWVQQFGLLEKEKNKHISHFADQLDPVLETRASPFGELVQLPPVAQFSITPPYWDLPPAPNGAFKANWQSK